MANNKPFVFEIAHEVANKVGGIYTVIRTKAYSTVQAVGSNSYFCVGMLCGSQARTEVEICEPTNQALARTLEKIRSEGIHVVFGKWLIEGNPMVILFDLGSAWTRLDGWKHDLYQNTYISTPSNDTETNNSVVFGYLVAWLIGDFVAQSHGAKVVVQFHEWLAGVGLILLRTRQINCATIFTTHATLLGRYLCAAGGDFYNNLSYFNCDLEAQNRSIYHRYCIERAATHCAHVFTTVSQITADEARHLLGRKADVILPNGLNVVKFCALHEFQNLHAINKAKIERFVRGHFYGHLNFDLDKTLYFFTAGRYEFSNKGVDMYIESLARLNHQLKSSNTDVTVVAFIIMPAATENYNVEALKGQAIMKQLAEIVDAIKDKVGLRMFDIASRGQQPNIDELINADDLVHLKRCIFSAQRESLPPITTHNIRDSDNDQVLCALRKCQLFNAHHDKVKVVFHPEFLNSTSPLLPMDYDGFVRGCHLGVFPSYYEPWGYTPAECAVMGVPSITSNLSGFGCFMEDQKQNGQIQDLESLGIFIVDRRMKSPEESLIQLSQFMFNFCQMDRRERINLRNRTERLSQLLDWNRLGAYYNKARLYALKMHYGISSFPVKAAPRFKNVGLSPQSPKIALDVSLDADTDTEDNVEKRSVTCA